MTRRTPIIATIKINVVIASILTGLALYGPAVGAAGGLAVSAVLCLLIDGAVELSRTPKPWRLLLPRRRVSRIVVLALVVLIGGTWLWEASAGKRGELMACRDIARFHLCVKRCGYGYEYPGDYSEQEQFLRDRYGVHLDAVAGCRVSQALSDYVEGYNSVSIPAIHKKFGRDIFEEYRQMEKEWFLSWLLDQLQDPDVKKRRSAASVLARNTGDPDGEGHPEWAEFVPHLVESLHDEDSEVRKWSAVVIGNIGPTAESAIPTLRQLSMDSDTDVREAAEKALIRIEPLPDEESS